MDSEPTIATDGEGPAPEPADAGAGTAEASLAEIAREWIEWSQRTGIHEPNVTEALRFFGYLMVERPDVLERSGDENAQWERVLGYLNTQRV